MPRAEILVTDTPQAFDEAVKRSVQLLKAGEVIALPTETVYGLAANAFDATAVAKIFQIKGRPSHNPIIVHVASMELASRCVKDWPPLAEKLGRAFWPGPLTVVLPRATVIPDVVTAGGPTVGIRWPSHPLIQAVIRTCDFPLAAPSANPAGSVSPTTAEHVRKYFGDRIPLIVDGGASHVGIESTVLDLSVLPPRILRPGMIYEQALLSVTGQLQRGEGGSERILKSPGQLARHYSPKARLIICQWNTDEDLRDQVEHHAKPTRTHIIAHTMIPAATGFGRVSVIPHDPEAFARGLYSELHACDEAGAELIVVEALPQSDEWLAIQDRLNRAAAQKQ